jgi:hypothetical protein
MHLTTLIQIKRNLGNTPVATPTLLDGELAFAKAGFLPNGGANELVIGDGASGAVLISNTRQLELTGSQTIASGTKTFAAGAKIAIAVADLNVAGGTAGNTLITDGAGNLSWGAAAASVSADGTTIVDNGGVLSVSLAGIADGITIKDVSGKLAVNKAVTADIEAGTANAFVDTAVLKTDVLGAGLSALTTTAKTVVPAINELRTEIAALTGVMIFAGTLDASTGDITAASGVPNVPANISAVDPALTKNYVWIVTVAGSNVGTGNTKPAFKQDWVASDGVKLVTLNYGMQDVVAANVGYTPGSNVYAVSNNVQDAIDELDLALRGPIDGGTFA